MGNARRTPEEFKQMMRGVVTIQFTPFKSVTEIDEGALRDNTQFMIENGLVEGRAVSVVGGSNGEGFSLSASQYRQLIDVVIEEANGRVPVCVGCIRPAAQPVIELARYAEEAGADGIMVLGPHYYPNEPADMVYAHFKAIADATDIPIMIYNNLFVTGQDLSVDLLRRLADIDQIVALKECTPYTGKLREVALRLADRFALIPCYTCGMPLAYQLGAVGFITLYGNFCPAVPLAMHDACLAHDFERAQKLYVQTRPLDAYGAAAVRAGGPGRETAIFKEVARLAGRPMGAVERLPLVRPSEDERGLVRRLMIESGLL